LSCWPSVTLHFHIRRSTFQPMQCLLPVGTTDLGFMGFWCKAQLATSGMCSIFMRICRSGGLATPPLSPPRSASSRTLQSTAWLPEPKCSILSPDLRGTSEGGPVGNERVYVWPKLGKHSKVKPKSEGHCVAAGRWRPRRCV
jgi:hypothetical protein